MADRHRCRSGLVCPELRTPNNTLDNVTTLSRPGADMAKAARVTIAEVEEIVPAGSIKPEDVHLPVCSVLRGDVLISSDRLSYRPVRFSRALNYDLHASNRHCRASTSIVSFSDVTMRNASRSVRWPDGATQLLRRGLRLLTRALVSATKLRAEQRLSLRTECMSIWALAYRHWRQILYPQVSTLSCSRRMAC